MSFLRKILDIPAAWFEEGGKLNRFYPLWEAVDTFLYTPGHVTRNASHVRDAIDLKRIMVIVVIGLIPCTLMAMYNTGLQANLVIKPELASQLPGWQNAFLRLLGLGHDPHSLLDNFIFGALFFLPAYIVTLIVGGAWETLFAIVRRHEINEGFLVTSLLFPLILPPTIPWWQIALGISFGVVIGKEIFGGVGMNIFNPALVGRAFLFFAYPGQISGNVWYAAPASAVIDGFTGATPLAIVKEQGLKAFAGEGASNSLLSFDLFDGKFSWLESFLGFIPGSMGETSTLACIIGAIIIIATGVASWRIVTGLALGVLITGAGFSLVTPSATNPMLGMPVYWHFVLGGLAFGAVFMATDPVSATFTERGKWIYGLMIGFFVVLIRTVNPAYPESVMLVILFMNICAPLIDYFVLQGFVKRRAARDAA
jgi:Na+-transporting NADH:ubiquinone oxidoreductase subunit B